MLLFDVSIKGFFNSCDLITFSLIYCFIQVPEREEGGEEVPELDDYPEEGSPAHRSRSALPIVNPVYVRNSPF